MPVNNRNNLANPTSTTDNMAPMTPEIANTNIVSLVASFLEGQVTFLNSFHIDKNDSLRDLLGELELIF